MKLPYLDVEISDALFVSDDVITVMNIYLVLVGKILSYTVRPDLDPTIDMPDRLMTSKYYMGYDLRNYNFLSIVARDSTGLEVFEIESNLLLEEYYLLTTTRKMFIAFKDDGIWYRMDVINGKPSFTKFVNTEVVYFGLRPTL